MSQDPSGGGRPLEAHPSPWPLGAKAAYIRSQGSFSASTSFISCSSRILKLLSKRTSSSNTTTWARPRATTCGTRWGASLDSGCPLPPG